jgi:hypothetical protein
MDLQNRNDPQTWSATVRKVDSSLHAAFARQQREAARRQPFWKRACRSESSSTGSETKQALQGSVV